MERVLELLRVPCPNAGCSVVVSCSETSAHVNHCHFTECTCPFSNCDFTCSFKYLHTHSVAEHGIVAPGVALPGLPFSMCTFECGTHVRVPLTTDKRIILKELPAREGEGEVVVVEWFDMPDGRIFYACCIGPGTDKFSYQLKLRLASGDELLFNSNLSRVSEVSDEPPPARFMLVPSCMLPYRESFICINRESHSDHAVVQHPATVPSL